jgi:cysteine desulfurase
MKTVYLDHAATTPLDPRVVDAMLPFMLSSYGNPSSIHHMGIEVKRAINEARSYIANLFGVSDRGVIFTSGGTESTNLALRGYASKHPEKKEIITSSIEHHATLHALDHLKKLGYIIHVIDVDDEGFINISQLEEKLSDQTLLVSIIWANNEIGTIQDINKMGELCHKYGAKLHVDAVQMVAHFPISFDNYPIDFLSLSAHKFYGPKGMGALIVRDYTLIDPILYGGNQEYGLRSGTENVYGIIGMKRALELKQEEGIIRQKHLLKLSQTLTERIKKDFPEVKFNGPQDEHKKLPGILSLSFPHIESQTFAFALDQKGIYVSTGSACLSNEVLESHVLKAIHSKDDMGTLRISFGKDSNIKDLPYVVKMMKDVYEQLKDA